MKIVALIKELNKIHIEHGNVEVMFQDPNSCDGPFTVKGIDFRIAEADEFPKSFRMPKGFKFVLLNNY